jgi:integrase/recombinase XerC
MQSLSTPILEVLEFFQLDNRSRRFSPNTIAFYDFQIGQFQAWCDANGVTDLESVSAHTIRYYLVALQDKGLKDTSVNAAARAIRRFLNFCVQEELIESSPMAKVRMPRIDRRILPALETDEVNALLEAAGNDRDKAIVLFLLDSGCRSCELVALNGADIDTQSGEVRIRQGKGGKDRMVFLGATTRRHVVRYYMRVHRPADDGPVWIGAKTGTRLTTSGLRQLLTRLGERAGVEHANPHTFRRTFAISCLRNGMNIYVLARLMGHADISVLRQYLDVSVSDLRTAHRIHGTVDKMLK